MVYKNKMSIINESSILNQTIGYYKIVNIISDIIGYYIITIVSVELFLNLSGAFEQS